MTDPWGTPQWIFSLLDKWELIQWFVYDLINEGKTIDLQFHGSHNYLVSQVIYYDSVSKTFFKSIKTPHEKSFLSILVCIVSTISRIACWVEWAWRKPYWDERNRRTTVSCTSGTFSPRNRRNACRNISPLSVKGGHTCTRYCSYGLNQTWSRLPVYSPMCPCETRHFKRQPLKSLSEDTHSESTNRLIRSPGLI